MGFLAYQRTFILISETSYKPGLGVGCPDHFSYIETFVLSQQESPCLVLHVASTCNLARISKYLMRVSVRLKYSQYCLARLQVTERE